MTEETTVAERPEAEIDFQGRKMFVRMLRPEQILVWQRTLSQLEKADASDWNATQVMSALERLRKIIDSMVANSTDVDWIDDEMLAGRLTFQQASKIVTLAVEKFAEIEAANGNRETRRAAAKPAKKATRKAAGVDR